MAPEQARGDELGPAADVWGIRVTLWEAATGRLAFGDSDTEEDAAEYPQLHRVAGPVNRHRRVPAELDRAIDHCLQPEPERRPTIAKLWTQLAHTPGTPDCDAHAHRSRRGRGLVHEGILTPAHCRLMRPRDPSSTTTAAAVGQPARRYSRCAPRSVC
jgi:serine/threonine protein kinase